MRHFFAAFSIQATLTIALLTGTNHAYAQSGLDPLWPISPTSPRECEDYQSAMNSRIADLNKQADRCEANLQQECDLERDGNRQTACYARIQQFIRRATECGNGTYLHSQACEPPAHAAACAEYRRDLYVQQCRAQVRQYQQRVAEEEARKREREQNEKKTAEEAQEKRANDELQRRERERESQTSRSSTELHGSSSSNPPVLAAQQPSASHSYSVGTLKATETEEQEHVRLEARQGEREERSEEALREMTDPFGKSTKSTSMEHSSGAAEIVDPFSSSQDAAETKDDSESAIVDPFAKSYRADKKIAEDKAEEITADKASDLIKEKANQTLGKLDKNLEKARLTMKPADFKVYRAEIEEAEAYLKGLSRVVEAAPFIKDAWEAADNWKEGWNDFAHDCESKGFEVVLKRLKPGWAEVWEGPWGWAASITFESSATQTPQQNLDALWSKDPSSYSFDQKVAALQQLYELQSKAPRGLEQCQRLPVVSCSTI